MSLSSNFLSNKLAFPLIKVLFLPLLKDVNASLDRIPYIPQSATGVNMSKITIKHLLGSNLDRFVV